MREQPVSGGAYRDTLAAWASGICLLTATAKANGPDNGEFVLQREFDAADRDGQH